LNLGFNVRNKPSTSDGNDQQIEGTSCTYFYNGENMLTEINIRDETDNRGT
jgi:hypothetical protein